MSSLRGAEVDAAQVFKILIEQNVGNYNPKKSALLLSPTLAELTSHLNQALFERGKIDTLTLFFAGHGHVSPASFVMCVSDTRISQATATGFSLTDLFLRISELAPVQTNIIIDACFSGGLVADLGILLRPTIMGDAGSPAVTLVATSARNEEAMEAADGGVGTTALLDCIMGTTFVNDASSSLDLAEIGRTVSERLTDRSGQTPIEWGLNLRGRSIFCRNPHYQVSADAAFAKWSPRGLLDALAPLLASHVNAPKDQVAHVERLSGGLVQRSKSSPELFHEIEVRSAAAVSLLEYCGIDDEHEEYIIGASLEISARVQEIVEIACNCISTNRFVLLTRGSGLHDLFYLPLRISKLLGWAGAAWFLDVICGSSGYNKIVFKRLTELLIEYYGTAIKSMSDAQAPYTVCGLRAAQIMGATEQAEIVTNLLFNSMLSVQGNVAASHIAPDKVLEYLLMRRKCSFDRGSPLIARPSELATVLLKCARSLELADAFDEEMENLDHLSINAFVPNDYSQFARETIHEGRNFSFWVGNDIWAIDDLESAWPKEANMIPDRPAVACGAILSALLFPDRVPWFVLSPEFCRLPYKTVG